MFIALWICLFKPIIMPSFNAIEILSTIGLLLEQLL